MNAKITLIRILSLSCLTSCSQHQVLKPLPHGHKPILENDRARVMEVILPPGGKVPLHTHDLPAVIIIHQTSKSIVRNSNAGKKTMHLYRIEVK